MNIRLSAIVAMSQNKVIGINQQLPWHLPNDLKHFKTLTSGHPILMGRKTFESIGKPLPNRTNIILTRQTSYHPAGCHIVHDLSSALQVAEQEHARELFIIGGSEIYQQLLPNVQRIYLTLVHTRLDGDAFFPEINYEEWQELEREPHEIDERHQYDYEFITLERKEVCS